MALMSPTLCLRLYRTMHFMEGRYPNRLSVEEERKSWGKSKSNG